ncbi:MAG: hydrogenase small subunit [Bacillota bacterium]
MRKLTRREFVKLCGMSAAGLSLMSLLGPQITHALAKAVEEKVPVVWIQGASCTGCSVSLLNSVDPSIEKVLLEVISLRYHPNIMAASGHLGTTVIEDVAKRFAGEFILVVEGGIPVNEKGKYCVIGEFGHKEMTAHQAVLTLGAKAKAVVAAGSCAAYGGIPAAAPNPTGVLGLEAVLNPKRYALPKNVINISNCPMHPDHFLGTLTYVLTYNEIPELDRYKRPLMFYGQPIHDNCPRRPDFEAGRFATRIGDEGCLQFLGCKGFIAMSDCPRRGWNSGTNWCIGAGAPCYACSEQIFPDGCAPLYGVMPVTGNGR